MSPEKVQQLKFGVYRIYWHQGGTSVGAIGQKHNGMRWLCCSNWTSPPERGTDSFARKEWRKVKRVELITGK